MCYYFADALRRETRSKIVHQATRDLADVDFDTIVVRGVSGMTIGPILAQMMDKEMAVIRKPEEVTSSHASYDTVGIIHRNWIVVDDFICGGGTLRKIIAAVDSMKVCPRDYSYGGRAIPFKTPDARFIGYYGYMPDWKSTLDKKPDHRARHTALVTEFGGVLLNKEPACVA